MSAALYTIPPEAPFALSLARGLMARAGAAPEALARMRVLLPTRRSCLALRDAFLRLAEDRTLLLPRLIALGDVDEEELALDDASGLDGSGLDGSGLPPAIAPLRRQLLLARLVLHWSRLRARREGAAAAMLPDQATRLAAELARLLDQVQTEGLGLDRLDALVPEEFARHWQITLDFLAILKRHWPRLLRAEGALDPADRRNRLLAAQAAAWRATPPQVPVIAAGSTGSIPATAELLATVATLPGGAVVLPGLDQALDEASWDGLEPSHPQYGLKRLLARLEVARDAVRVWEPPGAAADPAGTSRLRLLREAMRPAATAERWAAGAALDAAALAGLTRVDCPGSREEAAAIALVLRETLEARPAAPRRAALVTPDRDLARRVAAELKRWGVAVDDSAGVPLGDTPPGTFLRLLAEMAAAAAAPVPLLAALKHPLAAGGLAPGLFRARLRALERLALRGPRPAPGFAGLVAALEAAPARGWDAAGFKRTTLLRWTRGLGAACAPLTDATAAAATKLRDILKAHIAVAEALAETDAEEGPARLWAGEAGEAAANFVAELAEADALEPIPGAIYPALLAALMRGRAVRTRFGAHPRIAVLGPLEARLMRHDVTVLGGLNEGTWPAAPPADPWLSRPMRQTFGLPAAEERVGLAAHDFQQLACGGAVVLTRAERVEGTPTVPSRWLTRLDAVLRGAAATLPGWSRGPWLDWQRQLDRVQPFAAAAAPLPPEPRPPVEARPRRLSVTEIETWMRDPYAIYARHVLGLRALEEIDAPPDAAAYGSLLHAALARFVATCPDGLLPKDAEPRLIEAGRAAFAETLALPAVAAFWWPRFLRVARWFLAAEAPRRWTLTRAYVETKGRLSIAGPAGPFELAARADRIDLLPDGTLTVIDYKTGQAPSTKEVFAGFAPQLPLEAAIAEAGGFEGVKAGGIATLEYWRLGGGDPAGEVREVASGAEAATVAQDARAGLAELIRRYDDAATPYPARPRPDKAPRFSDYEHLARVKEWAPGQAGPGQGEGEE